MCLLEKKYEAATTLEDVDLLTSFKKISNVLLDAQKLLESQNEILSEKSCCARILIETCYRKLIDNSSMSYNDFRICIEEVVCILNDIQEELKTNEDVCLAKVLAISCYIEMNQRFSCC